MIGYDVAAAEEGTTQETPAEDRPGYAPERDLAAEPAVDRTSYEEEPGVYDQEVDPARRPSEGG